MELIKYMASSRGKFHETNEDSCRCGRDFVIIADGMGGESSGEVASQIAVDSISEDIARLSSVGSVSKIKDALLEAIIRADRRIQSYIESHPETYGMGTTVLVMYYYDNRLYIAWCGDSRCLLCRKGQLTSLTHDHSYVQELIDSKQLSVEQSFMHPDNNLITRFVGGGEETCLPEYVSSEVLPDDKLILCSDGLCGYCRPSEICKTITSSDDLSELPSVLLNLALDCGSDDDITVVAAGVAPKINLFNKIRRIFSR
ncbi:MAG: protein phosphatase 2C domain-containing protein [Duncaniella dubosii]|nr:protein phosphatase 2C domain-containing protein [Duncaniella dubosii]